MTAAQWLWTGANGHGPASVQLYSTLKGMITATEKVAVTVNFSLLRAALVSLTLLWLELSPFLGLLPLGPRPLQLASGAVVQPEGSGMNPRAPNEGSGMNPRAPNDEPPEGG